MKDSIITSYAEYNPDKDISPVDPIGFVDIREAYVNGNVPSDISVSPLDFNDVDDPESLLGRGSDIFDNLRRADYVSGSSAKSDDTTGSGEHE